MDCCGVLGAVAQSVYNRRIVWTQAGNAMCGIIGYLDKRGRQEQPVGQVMLSMLGALSCRGPDSAGVAVFGFGQPAYVVRLKVPEAGYTTYPQLGGSWDRPSDEHPLLPNIQAGLENEVMPDDLPGHARVTGLEDRGAFLRVQVETELDARTIERRIAAILPGFEVVSLGHKLEIVKQVGSPSQLETGYRVSQMAGSHGIGHTRLSTESRVDLSHSQPFWAHGVPDLATVHNGHITNYHKLRRQYEQRGYRFYTENDSEIIGVYLRDRLAAGLSIPDALRSSLDDFDGSFSYLAAWSDGLAYVKDRFGFKPLMVAETDDFVAIATEELALRQALGRDFRAREPAPGKMHVWSIPATVGTRS
jgi:glutamate synthase domain-containing protein 1